MKFTVLGGSGFIGSNLVSHLKRLGVDCFTPDRNDSSIFNQELGHVIYCVGLTADFRQKPFETVKAHVCYLIKILEKCQFDSFLYLSSTRVYYGLNKSNETVTLEVNPLQLNDLYNISKLLGEAACFSINRSGLRVVRMSNIIGKDFSSANFLSSIIKEAVDRKNVILRTSLRSAKDYIGIDEVVSLLPKIATSGRQRIYNIASGINVSNQEILNFISKLTGCCVNVSKAAETIIYPKINIQRIKDEFGFNPTIFFDLLKEMVLEYNKGSIHDKN